MKHYNQLPRVAFSILLALSLKQRHGYEIIKQIEADSNGKVQVGPGALYTSIKQLLKQGLIVEVANDKEPKRRYYKLSENGHKVLSEELEYYENAVNLARQRNALHNAKPNFRTI
ncbi:PadR family transcriptional regulator [Candidatus Saccharibacteria bacterium]|nr:PadR family transcriptional regulator [Candidatus Saccharibacteria bacterium]